jgi:hypothetical protein
VLAEQADGILISDLGESGRSAVVHRDRLEHSAASGPMPLLATWREGLEAIGIVHARGRLPEPGF